MELAGKHILVIGMAKTGQAAVRFLLEQGCRVGVTDAKPVEAWRGGLPPAGSAPGRWEVRAYDPASLSGIDLVIPSPGVPPQALLLREAGKRRIPILSELEVAAAFLRPPMIAVTGTNGKTTTTRLIGDILAAAGYRTYVGGNIGNPLIDYVRGSQPDDWAVVEASSFQLVWTERLRPRTAVLLNVTDDHIDYHGSLAAYREAKERLFRRQGPGDRAVLNADDPGAEDLARRLQGEVAWFSSTRPLAEGAFLQKDALLHRKGDGNAEAYPRSEIRLPGDHNVENILAAILACRDCPCAQAAIRAAIGAFRGLPHRIAYTATRRGVAYYNDSKGTNVGAVQRALASFDRPVVLLLGGRDKEGNFADLASSLSSRVRMLILFGEARQVIADRLGPVVPTRHAGGLGEAIALAHRLALPGEAVLLSPGCSSFDEFTDYKARGDFFQRTVEGLADA